MLFFVFFFFFWLLLTVEDFLVAVVLCVLLMLKLFLCPVVDAGLFCFVSLFACLLVCLFVCLFVMETIVSPCYCCVRLAVAIVTLLTEGPSDSRGFTLTALQTAPPVPGRLQPRCVAVRVARSREPTPVTGVYSVPETIQVCL